METSILAQSVRLALAIMAGAAPLAALAQAAGAPTAPQAPVVEKIEVTGVRASLESAVHKKRDAEAILDAISTEDIGKFPDQNLAESLQHITGVQISRADGEGQQVSIRGLDPQFNRVLFNGRELTSPTGDRSFDFANLSSTFISTLEVYKTPMAEKPEGGLAGTVNVVTANPLDIGKRAVAGTLTGTYDQNARRTTPHAAILYNDVTADKTLGISLGLDYDKKSIDTQLYQAWGLEPRAISGLAPVVAPNSGNVPPNTVVGFNNAASFGANVGTVERSNMLATVQYKPSARFEGKLNVIYSKAKTSENLPLDSFRPTNIGGPNAAVTGYQVTDGVLTSLSATGLDFRNNARANDLDDTLFSPAISARYRGDQWTVDGEISTSSAKRVASSLGLEVIGRASGTTAMGSNWGAPPTMTFAPGYDPMDPKNFVVLGVNGSYKQPNEEKNKTFKLDFQYRTGADLLPRLGFGVQHVDNSESVGSSHLSVDAQTLAKLLNVPYNAAVEGGSFSAAPYMATYTQSAFSMAPRQWLASDLNVLLKQVPLSALIAASPLTSNLAGVYTVDEKSDALYAKADFSLLEDRLSGNLGLRAVTTHQRSSGYAPDLSQITFSQQGAVTNIPSVTPTSISRSYTNVLPTFNARYELSSDKILRFAAAQVMSRPNLQILAPNTSVNANVKTINEGNPNVKPFLANQFDVSFEWYLPKGGLLSAAAFYKDVKNFIVSTSSTENLNVKLVEGGGSVTIPFTVNKPDNGANSQIKGFEFGYQQPLTFLPGLLHNLGVMANYTYVDAGRTRVTQGGPLIPLPGVSKNNYNLIAYYDDGEFEARIAYTFRDKFVVDSSSYFGDGQFTNAYNQLDFSSTYKVNKSWSLLFNAINLSNSGLTNVNKIGVNRGTEYAGRRYTLGANFKF